MSETLPVRLGRVLPLGATIGLLAPSRPIDDAAVDAAVRRLESWGYRTRLGDVRQGYPTGSGAARAADLNAMWADPAVDGILCVRGGYGAMHMLEGIDWALVRERPLFFGGFSDVTALHAALERLAGLVTFHSPMAWAMGGAKAYNATELRRAMTTAAPLGDISWPSTAAGPDDPLPEPWVIRPGVAEGRLAGGNLSLICALMGTPYEPDFTGRIVLLEDVDEAPYRVDRMLMQLLLAGKLQRAAGVVFGDSPSCVAPEGTSPPATLAEVLEPLLAPLGIPVLYGFPCGHTAYRATIPLGVAARLDASAARLTVLESALKV